jgi:hypothetical protein
MHAPRRVERRRRREHDAQPGAVLVEGLYVVGQRLVVPAMPLILRGVSQEIAMELLDVVLGEGDRLPIGEHRLHDLSVTGYLLLVAVGEGLKVDV